MGGVSHSFQTVIWECNLTLNSWLLFGKVNHLARGFAGLYYLLLGFFIQRRLFSFLKYKGGLIVNNKNM